MQNKIVQPNVQSAFENRVSIETPILKRNISLRVFHSPLLDGNVRCIASNSKLLLNNIKKDTKILSLDIIRLRANVFGNLYHMVHGLLQSFNCCHRLTYFDFAVFQLTYFNAKGKFCIYIGYHKKPLTIKLQLALRILALIY